MAKTTQIQQLNYNWEHGMRAKNEFGTKSGLITKEQSKKIALDAINWWFRVNDIRDYGFNIKFTYSNSRRTSAFASSSANCSFMQLHMPLWAREAGASVTLHEAAHTIVSMMNQENYVDNGHSDAFRQVFANLIARFYKVRKRDVINSMKAAGLTVAWEMHLPRPTVAQAKAKAYGFGVTPLQNKVSKFPRS